MGKARYIVAPKVFWASEIPELLSVSDPELTQVRHLVPFVANLLEHCSGLKTLSQHASEVWGKLTYRSKAAFAKKIIDAYSNQTGEIYVGPGAFSKMIEVLFESAAQSGEFVSEKDFCFTTHGDGQGSGKITSMAIASSNRVLGLKRCLESYSMHYERWGRNPRYVICENSSSETASHEYRSMIEDFAMKHNKTVVLSSRLEREAFCSKLDQKGISPELSRFALLGSHSWLSNYGANRNALYLLTLGEHVFCADDDTLPNVRGALENQGRVRFRVQDEAVLKIDRFSTREEAIGASQPLDQCLLELHEKFLGQSVKNAWLEGALKDAQNNSLERISKEDYASLFRGDGKIRCTFNGLVGDSGSGDTLAHLWNESNTKCAPEGREIRKWTSHVTLSREYGCMTTFYGADHRALLPPFFPHFRMEDATFALLLGHFWSEDRFAFLPWELEHSPIDRRINTQATALSNELFLSVHDVLKAIASQTTYVSRGSPQVNLEAFGRRITDFCKLPKGDLSVEMRRILISGRVAGLRGLASLKASKAHRGRGKAWLREVEDALGFQQRELSAKLVLSEREAYLAFGQEEAERRFVEDLRLFGELLIEWGDLVSASRELQFHGVIPGGFLSSAPQRRAA